MFYSIIAINAEVNLINVPTFSVEAQCYDKTGFVADCHVLFTIKDGQHYIRVEDTPYGMLTCFSAKENGTLSTSFTSKGTRWWYTGSYIVNNRIDLYQMVIFDPQEGGGCRIFYKTCPPDKSSMSESKCFYEISADDYKMVKKKFIIESSKTWEGGLKSAKTGDPFRDGVHLNSEAVK